MEQGPDSDQGSETGALPFGEADADASDVPDSAADAVTPLDVLREFWGYESFRPLQAEAVDAVLADRDSLVVLPTGGGKSLCYQVPALLKEGTAVVISPLISLMKDQVDALNGIGVNAAYLNSTQTGREQQYVIDDLASGECRLLYVSPERLLQEKTLSMLESLGVSLFAIDEAHCISAWGHDFRPEFRGLKTLKSRFPGVGVHAYTATATEPVRQDIAKQLRLRDPDLLVGNFDRPNLNYKVRRRTKKMAQILEVLNAHTDESGIIYCISKREVDQLSESLSERGFKALPYHAGMSDDERAENQEAFINDDVDIIVATVAFGMGIDKPNIRYVIHSGMPKSLENYQQESGRAGRDGLEAECVLLYTGNDAMIWKRIVEERMAGNYQSAIDSIEHMSRYCKSVVCRHKQLVNHFGQQFEAETCGACDVCLDDIEMADDPLLTAQKVLSAVHRQRERFGREYTVLHLAGADDQRIRKNGHDQLTTYGLLADQDRRTIRDWIEQLVGQGYLQPSGEYNVLTITPAGRKVLKGEETPRLTKPRDYRSAPKSRAEAESWEGVDRELFRRLKSLRKRLADERDVASYMVFGDATLREMARDKPLDEDAFRRVKGVGEKKLADFGTAFIEEIGRHTEGESAE